MSEAFRLSAVTPKSAARAVTLAKGAALMFGGAALAVLLLQPQPARANCYELIAYFAKLPPATAMVSSSRTGQRTVPKPNIQRFSRVTGDDREHNAAKPVDLLAELIDAGSDRGDVVLDLFDGSGSTRIACEKAGRRCFGMEMEPKFVQVAIERWERFTNQKAKKVS